MSLRMSSESVSGILGGRVLEMNGCKEGGRDVLEDGG